MSMDLFVYNPGGVVTVAVFQCPEEHSMSMDFDLVVHHIALDAIMFQCPEEHSMSMDRDHETRIRSNEKRGFSAPKSIRCPWTGLGGYGQRGFIDWFQCPEEHSMSMDNT